MALTIGRTIAVVALMMTAVFNAACGSNSPNSPTPTPTPTGPTATTFTGTIGAYAITSHELDAPTGRTLDVTLTWTTAVDLDLYLTATDCTGYPPDRCHLLARSTESTGQREELTWAVSQGARLKVWVDNFSRAAGTDYTVVVTPR